MFSGIIESTGVIRKVIPDGSNKVFTVESSISHELRIDQSVAHNGVCLTVTSVSGSIHTVTAISETLEKSNLGALVNGDLVNLERSLKVGDRLDGHIVQGHVDITGKCISITDQNGSSLFTFEYPKDFSSMLVEKGSITVNGVSLTAFNCSENRFSVAIIPYTFNNTTFSTLRKNDSVNLEFDILGKYFRRNMEVYFPDARLTSAVADPAK